MLRTAAAAAATATLSVRKGVMRVVHARSVFSAAVSTGNTGACVSELRRVKYRRKLW